MNQSINRIKDSLIAGQPIVQVVSYEEKRVESFLKKLCQQTLKSQNVFTALIGTPQGFPMFAKVGDKFADGYVLSITDTQVVLRKTHERGIPLIRPRDVIKEITEEL